MLYVFSFGGDGDDVNGDDVVHESLHMDSVNQHKLTKYYGEHGVLKSHHPFHQYRPAHSNIQ